MQRNRINKFNYIFIPNVLKFCKACGTIKGEFPFCTGRHHVGKIEARPEGNFHSSVWLYWHEHEDYSRCGELESPSCNGDISSLSWDAAGRYSNMGGLPALLVVVCREKEDVRYE